jgi:hypothetical protein
MKASTTQTGARSMLDDTNILWGDKYQKREMMYGVGYDACICCGKDTDSSKGVVVGDGGYVVIHSEDVLLEEQGDPAGYMGWFPVGSDCIRKIPADFRAARPN